MRKPIHYASLCSGIEAAHIALSPLGFTADWFSEIAPFPSAVLAEHLPHAPNHGDMCALVKRIQSAEITAPDLLCAGTPCQSFSTIGLRDGLSDTRGNLTLELVNILETIDNERAKMGKPPAVLLWENVRGVLSSADNAFGHFLAALAGMREPLDSPRGYRQPWPSAGCVIGSKRRIAWRILNAKYFGIPQSRPRLFLVASAGADKVDSARVLFETESRRQYAGESRKDSGSQQEEPLPFNAVPYTGAEKMRSDAGGNRLISPCLLTSSNDFSVTGCSLVIAENGLPRRLTPIERERLQGLPDNWTQIPWKGKPAAECPYEPRITAIGNAWAVPVVSWIGQRLKAAMRPDD